MPYETIIDLIKEAIIFIFPAYCANAIPVLAGGGKPIDLNKKFPDGKPVFGSNKTIRGFIAGLAVGTIVGILQNLFFNYNVFLGFMVSLGALIGDLIESFVKRRLNFEPGRMLPIADQLDFVFGALLFSTPIIIPKLEVVLVLILITPPIHIFTNFAAYLLKLKKTPW